MQKIKYIIIFFLLLVLAMIYMRLMDYENITNTLLQENNKQHSKTKDLENKISILENKTAILQNEKILLENKIITLDETLLSTQMRLNNTNFTVENNETYPIPFNVKDMNISKDIYTTQEQAIDLTPNITLDDENKVTGFGLQYKNKF